MISLETCYFLCWKNQNEKGREGCPQESEFDWGGEEEVWGGEEEVRPADEEEEDFEGDEEGEEVREKVGIH